jgi:hypothetical protein
MVKAFLLGPAVIFIKGTIMRMRGRVMVKCSGQMEVCTRVNGSAVYSMVLAA